MVEIELLRAAMQSGARDVLQPPYDPEDLATRMVALAHEAGCALGVCAGCVATGSQGPVRVCREGPAFAADELRWEPAS